MIISRTPFRISFFGGGTDYPVWYEKNNGAVLAVTIDKYCYITLRYLPPFFEHKHRVVYSLVEKVNSSDEIQHPVIKALFRMFKICKGLEVHHDGDLPARAGLGSSSAFTVGMLNSLYALEGKIVSKGDLAKQAIHVERNLLKENVGSQDQVAVAYGGFNKITFNIDHSFKVEPLTVKKERIKCLQEHLVLIFTGLSRFASEIAVDQIKNTAKKNEELSILRQMVEHGIDILNSDRDIGDFGGLLHESWQIKRSLSSKISNSAIDNLYEKALKNGALGGKLLGAGGGGFMLLFVSPERQKDLRRALSGLLEVKFSFEDSGTQIIYYNV